MSEYDPNLLLMKSCEGKKCRNLGRSSLHSLSARERTLCHSELYWGSYSVVDVDPRLILSKTESKLLRYSRFVDLISFDRIQLLLRDELVQLVVVGLVPLLRAMHRRSERELKLRESKVS